MAVGGSSHLTSILVVFTLALGLTAVPAGADDRWHPDPAALAAAAEGPATYDEAPAWDGGASCSHGLTTAATALAATLRARFGPLEIGGYSCRPNTASSGRTSVHGVGRALDVMTTAGAPIADWLLAHSSELGVQLVIWNRSLWRAGAAEVRPYGGPNPHTDHVHVEVRIGATGTLRRAVLVS
ncbi:MAG: hypothetical protein U0U69_01930 [Acidimicrobiia bacterium]